MKRKTTSICLTVIMATASMTTMTQAFADSTPVTSRAGGQSAPPATGGSGFTVRVASNYDNDAANTLKQNLVKEGFTAAETRPAGNGTYEVIIGQIASRTHAEKIVSDLKDSGYTTSVEIISGSSAAASDSPATGQTIYRVEVAEFDTAAEATEASKALLDERFVNVDIVEENGKHVVMLGTFNRQQDAQALLVDVNEAGFALAAVVTREKLNTSGNSASTADLSSLPADQQAETRDILAMAEKVERGEATADEERQLRERRKQLTASQDAIVTQQERNRSTEQNKLQKTYPLYREFDQALRARNFDKADQLLAEVRQINPDDIFLPGKVRLLSEQRSGGSSSAPANSSTGSADPAQVQTAINEARAAEATGDKNEALQKFRAVLTLDPNNIEARNKVLSLESPASTTAAAPEAETSDNKNLIYGGAGLLALALLAFGWMKMRGRKEAAAPITSTTSSFGTESIDPLGTDSTFSTGFDTGINTTSSFDDSNLTSMTGLHHLGADDDEESNTLPKPAPAPQPVVQESESVSLEDMAPESPQPSSEEVVLPEINDEVVSLNFDEEPAPAQEAPSKGSAMEADLEALLRSTLPSEEIAPEPVSNEQEVVAEEIVPAAPAQAQLIFSQNFNGHGAGEAAEGWRGEYDYATLVVEDLGEPGHSKALKFEKSEGSGSATYHLSFPKASGKVIAEFDIRCDQKNKFLLGVYFEKDEDFKQSIHTIIHQLDPNSPASLRIQGEGVPYEMGTWSHIRYEVDIANGTIDAYQDDNHVIQGASLSVVPEYINTLSIRDNLATTGLLYLDNIKISEA